MFLSLQLQASDKDEKYMAISDLSNALDQEGFKMDAESERRFCTIMLKNLEHSSSDIKQVVCTKCCSP